MFTVTEELKQFAITELDCPKTWTDDSLYRDKLAEALADGTLSPEQLKTSKTMTTTAEKVFNSGGNVRVKAPSEQYDETRYTAKSAKTGEPVFDPVHQREVTTQSQGAKARAGVLFKHLANKSGVVHNPLSEHERALLDEMANEKTWAGKIGSEWYDGITGHHNVKALIDDSTSGGLEIAPIEFDSDVISFPLLYGELFPKVDLKPVSRGRRIEGASITTPTMQWGGVDDTAIDLFTTTSMVSAIDTTIFAIDGAIEVGRDFLSDSPVNVGNVLTGLVGERLMAELDKVIANGNGTTQPEGLFQASGVSTVSSDNGNTGPATLNDYISLLFTVAKQYRKSMYRPTFVSNDTVFQRSRSIKVDPQTSSTDQRPVIAPLTVINNYETLGWAHGVQNDLANTVLGFACMAKYRMYRRLGMEMRFVEGGKDLARRNMMLLVYRARFGGRLMDANAFAKLTDMQS